MLPWAEHEPPAIAAPFALQLPPVLEAVTAEAPFTPLLAHIEAGPDPWVMLALVAEAPLVPLVLSRSQAEERADQLQRAAQTRTTSGRSCFTVHLQGSMSAPRVVAPHVGSIGLTGGKPVIGVTGPCQG
jgi:hypothetical protein